MRASARREGSENRYPSLRCIIAAMVAVEVVMGRDLTVSSNSVTESILPPSPKSLVPAALLGMREKGGASWMAFKGASSSSSPSSMSDFVLSSSTSGEGRLEVGVWQAVMIAQFIWRALSVLIEEVPPAEPWTAARAAGTKADEEGCDVEDEVGVE